MSSDTLPAPAVLTAYLLLMMLLGCLAGQTGIPVEDGGEFLTVARLGGVNHPPGLPLLSISARLSWVLFGRQGLRILFALLAASTLILLDGRRTLQGLLMAAGALLLPAVSGRLLMWDAYSPLILVFSVALLRRPGLDLEGGYLTGLALAIHPQGILLPILCRWRRPSPLRFTAGMLLGLSLFLSLPLGSAAGTILDWGSTGDIQHFIRHVSAAGYREVYGGSMGGFSMDVLLRYLGSIGGMLWPVLLVPAAIGVQSLLRKDRNLLVRLGLLLAADLLFVLTVNPMASGTTQTATLALLVVLFLSFKGINAVSDMRKEVALALGAAVLISGVLMHEPLPDQEERVRDFVGTAPLESGFFLQDNDLLYGGWVVKYVEDRRPDLVLLSTGNFSGWFEDMAVYFNPDLDLSRGVLDVGDLDMDRYEAAVLLMRATVEDNPGREFFSDLW